MVKRFGGLTAVDHVTLQVEEGQILGLVGPNGAGKTTLLNCVAGALSVDGGSIRFMGKDITRLPAYTRCRMGIARTYQLCQPFSRLTVWENVLVGAVFGGRHPWKRARQEANRALDAVGFIWCRNTPAEQLNTAQLKRLELARALACSPKLLLLDEVASGLSAQELKALMDVIRGIRDSGVTIILVEHLLRVIVDLCDWVAVLHYGKKIAEGSPLDVLSSPQVAEAYLGRSSTKVR